ncbi:MAG: leucyl aminopeptidase [Syntrophobacteraceae bacterium]|nr:leucyl aminopeptidase [Syntrophobacteraceae bacterium]
MEIDRQIAAFGEWQADALIFFTVENSPEPLPGFQRWMQTEAPWLTESPGLRDFQGKPQQATVLYAPHDQRIPRVVCVGLGALEKLDLEKVRTATATALRKCRDLRLSRPALPLLAFEGLPFEWPRALEEALIGGILGLYRFSALKTKDVDADTQLQSLVILSETDPGEEFPTAVRSAEAMASGVSLARDLVVAPGNRVTPTFIAEIAQGLSESYGCRMQLFNLNDALNMGMRAFAAVAQGSREPACIVVLEYCPTGMEDTPPIVFIGKGITFDTGGISIKPSNKLEAMKQDMAGAAAVLGAFEVVGKLGIKRRLIGVLPCTENMPDGKAYKPGDVIQSMSGLMVEVISTDAEGRMILCDAITYALQYKPAVIVDLATLTGACIVALGNEVAAVMGNREALVERLRGIGMEVGERLWPLPLWDSYFEYIKSDIADFKNVGDRSAGTIVGGIFLKQFVPDDVPWAHVDIAGTAWTEKDTGMAPKGATGFGVRLLVEIARRWDEPNI